MEGKDNSAKASENPDTPPEGVKVRQTRILENGPDVDARKGKNKSRFKKGFKRDRKRKSFRPCTPMANSSPAVIARRLDLPLMNAGNFITIKINRISRAETHNIT